MAAPSGFCFRWDFLVGVLGVGILRVGIALIKVIYLFGGQVACWQLKIHHGDAVFEQFSKDASPRHVPPP